MLAHPACSLSGLSEPPPRICVNLRTTSKKSFYENIHNRTNRNRLQSRRYFTGRFWSQRNFYRGKGNARADGDPGERCAAETGGIRAHQWIVADHDSGGRMDQDTLIPRTACAL